MTTSYEFGAFFTKNGSGVAPSSAPTITVIDSANNVLVAAATATTALTNLVGAYRYSYSGADGLTCYAKFTTTDLTCDQYEIGCVPKTIVPTVGQIDTQLTSSHGAGAWNIASGGGSTLTTVTVESSGTPLGNVSVQVSTDSAGSNVIASGTTNSFGVATFYLNSGTYYLWRQLVGYNFPQGVTLTV